MSDRGLPHIQYLSITTATVTAALSMVMMPTPAASTEPPSYLDDRSNAVAVIQSLYNALNRREFLRAYGYWGEETIGKSFEDYRQGFASTDDIELVTGKPTSEGGAGSIYYTVPVAIHSVENNGDDTVYAGCYHLRMVQPAIQEMPPFVPIHITKGELKPTDEPLATALPEDCSS